MSAHSAPLQALGTMRSAGIRDLRHGGAHLHQPPLPAHVRSYAVAGSMQAQPSAHGIRHPRGDGLVTVASALGEHPDPRCRLPIPDARKQVVYGTGHIALLASAPVHDRLRAWLA